MNNIYYNNEIKIVLQNDPSNTINNEENNKIPNENMTKIFEYGKINNNNTRTLRNIKVNYKKIPLNKISKKLQNNQQIKNVENYNDENKNLLYNSLNVNEINSAKILENKYNNSKLDENDNVISSKNISNEETIENNFLYNDRLNNRMQKSIQLDKNELYKNIFVSNVYKINNKIKPTISFNNNIKNYNNILNDYGQKEKETPNRKKIVVMKILKNDLGNKTFGDINIDASNYKNDQNDEHLANTSEKNRRTMRYIIFNEKNKDNSGNNRKIQIENNNEINDLYSLKYINSSSLYNNNNNHISSNTNKTLQENETNYFYQKNDIENSIERSQFW